MRGMENIGLAKRLYAGSWQGWLGVRLRTANEGILGISWLELAAAKAFTVYIL